jgi:predicted aminopeptidase
LDNSVARNLLLRLKSTIRKVGSPVLLLATLLLAEGCYYVQAARGQYDLLHRRRPVGEVIADESSPEQLRKKLEMLTEARQFAVDGLLLPDNDSYRTYVELERDYVVWNVMAAPEFSLEPRQWCYPIAGCVAYRGYFDEGDARELAGKLASQDFDVLVGGVPAYSTLGRFDDPLLSTMMHWSDADLVATLFHELAHQKLYVKGDTGFNESFATTVADIGLRRWLLSRGEPGAIQERQIRQAKYAAALDLAKSARDQLEILYSSGLDPAAMRERKRQIFAELESNLRAASADSHSTSRLLDGTLNNARLVSIGLYEGRVSAFKALLKDCGDDLACFYSRAEELAKMSREDRDGALEMLGARHDSGR